MEGTGKKYDLAAVNMAWGYYKRGGHKKPDVLVLNRKVGPAVITREGKKLWFSHGTRVAPPK